VLPKSRHPGWGRAAKTRRDLPSLTKLSFILGPKEKNSEKIIGAWLKSKALPAIVVMVRTKQASSPPLSTSGYMNGKQL
jgi:hypothetical protein